MAEEPGFKEGDPVWVMQADGSARAGVFVGEVETSAWFGGPPRIYVVFPESESGEAVEFDRVTHRDPE
ncbi:MAG: hypothetical protein U0R52_06265 [Solirubrobacterales bacterium]